MSTINIMLEELLKKEGGYVNHPNDRGGPTNYGVTEQQARAYGYAGDMRNLPRSTALNIYRQMYWSEPKFDLVASRLPALAMELFDTGVNMGPSRAARFLQRVLNALNKRGTVYKDLIVDGNIGNMTLYALDNFIKSRGRRDAEHVLLEACDAQQAVRYIEIAEANPSQEDFVFGWLLNRVGA